MKTNAPHAPCNNGNVIPTIKLHVHDERLPKAIAAGRGELSNNSKKTVFYYFQIFEKMFIVPEPIKYGIGPKPN